jgi:hypothetical protein
VALGGGLPFAGPDSASIEKVSFPDFLDLGSWSGLGSPSRHDLRNPGGLDVVFSEAILPILDERLVTSGLERIRASPIVSDARRFRDVLVSPKASAR